MNEPQEPPCWSVRWVPQLPTAWRQDILKLAAGNLVNTEGRHPVVRAAMLKAAAELIVSTISDEEADAVLAATIAPPEPAPEPEPAPARRGGKPRKQPEQPE
jgi:hypothetical protein